MSTPSNQQTTGQYGLRRVWPLFVLLLLLAACVSPTPAPAPVAPQEAAAPTATATATAAPPPTAPPVADEADLPQMFADSLGIVLQPDSGRWEGVEVLQVAPSLWATFTTGFRPFDPIKNHAVGIFTQEDGFWVELGRVELECSDYVDSRSVRQVALDPTSIWLAVDSGAGAHSGCFDLLRWDGAQLTIAASGFNSSPGAGDVQDVDGDGQPEVVLNNSDPYVFCYACGVRLYDMTILRWDGARLKPVELTRLPGDTVTDLRRANNRAVDLAAASLFPAALPLIDQALAYAPSDERVYWNHQFIHALAQGRRDYANSSPYPLLNWVFAGDWARAVDDLRDYSPAQVFDPNMALLQESAAAGWEETLADWILQFAAPALDAQPDLAPAWFLQGWAAFLKNPNDPAAQSAVEQAVHLAADDAFYGQSLEQLQGRGVSQLTVTPTATPSPGIPLPATIETVRFLAGATVHELQIDLTGGVVRGYRLGIGDGQTLYVTGPTSVRAWLFDAAGNPLPGAADAGAVRFDIPAMANYTLVLQGNAPVDILLAIPPLSLPETIPPATSERVRFAVGATRATLEPTLTRGAPIGYLLGIGAGQRMWVTAPAGDMDFWVLDVDGKTLSPITPRTMRSAEFAIPRTGDYTLVVDGDGPAQVVVDIPP